MAAPLPTGGVGLDARGLETLKARARDDPKSVAREAARQFEAVFLNQVLKQMRAALPGGDPLSSNATKLQTELFDQQLSERLAQRGTGLGAQIARHLERVLGAQQPAGARAAAPATLAAPLALAAPTRVASAAATPAATPAPRSDFVDRIGAFAEDAARLLRVPPSFVIGQAALESAWGAREIRSVGGEPSHNLFGIKAGASWNGATVEAVTTEVIGGVARKVVQRFRAYESYAEGFADYAKLLAGRYAAAVGAPDASAFARGIAQGGYATDPAYAAKLERTIASVVPASGSAKAGR